MTPDLQILNLYISPGHNFFGHHGQPAGTHPVEEVPEVRCLAGRGLAGDRFLDFKADYKGQITFLADEVYQDLCRQLGVFDKPAAVLRRNVLTRGIDLGSLIGLQFAIQGVHFAGVEECRPCSWMDQAFGPGAEAALRGRGGLRARILSNGVLRVGAGTSAAVPP